MDEKIVTPELVKVFVDFVGTPIITQVRPGDSTTFPTKGKFAFRPWQLSEGFEPPHPVASVTSSNPAVKVEKTNVGEITCTSEVPAEAEIHFEFWADKEEGDPEKKYNGMCVVRFLPVVTEGIAVLVPTSPTTLSYVVVKQKTH